MAVEVTGANLGVRQNECPPQCPAGVGLCPVFDVTLQDRCGTAGQRPELHQRVRSITEEGNTEQIGLIYSIIPTVWGL